MSICWAGGEEMQLDCQWPLELCVFHLTHRYLYIIIIFDDEYYGVMYYKSFKFHVFQGFEIMWSRAIPENVIFVLETVSRQH